jgi:hypothetical protein
MSQAVNTDKTDVSRINFLWSRQEALSEIYHILIYL